MAQLNSIIISRNPFYDPIDDSEIADGNNDINETTEGDNEENFNEEQ
jgi:hypothetical protein